MLLQPGKDGLPLYYGEKAKLPAELIQKIVAFTESFINVFTSDIADKAILAIAKKSGKNVWFYVAKDSSDN